MTLTRTAAPAAASRPARSLADRRRRITPTGPVTALTILLLAGLPYFADNFTVTNFTMVIIYGIAILSLDVVTGHAGQVSLGHGGLMGMGAYTAGLLIVHAGLNPYLTLLIAPLTTAVLGLAFAVSALRLAGLHLALATFALALTVPQFAKYFSSITGGTQGLILPVLSSPTDALTIDQWLYYLVLAVGLVCLGLSQLFLRGRVGRALNAIRDSGLAATVCGINLRNYKFLAFFVSSLFAGLAGALLALVTAFVSPDSFTFILSLALFVGLGIAGFTSMASPLIGGIIIVYLPLLSGELYAGKPDIAYGAIIVALVLLGRGGIVDLAKSLFRLLGRLRLPTTERTEGRAS
jgi:branched-chain amino acid transport system permease protein